MSFLSKLMQDAQPKVDSLKAIANRVSNAVNNAPVTQATKGLGYKGLVNTVGVVAVVVKPAYGPARQMVVDAKMWAARQAGIEQAKAAKK